MFVVSSADHKIRGFRTIKLPATSVFIDVQLIPAKYILWCFAAEIERAGEMSLFHYITYKLVIIKDKRLGVIYYSFASIIVLFTLVEIFVNKGYLEVGKRGDYRENRNYLFIKSWCSITLALT